MTRTLAPTLRDPEAEARLEAHGFAVVPLPRGAVEAADRLLARFDPPCAPPFHVTTVHPDLSFRRDVSESLVRELGPLLGPLFTGHRAYHGTFLLQPAGAEGLGSPHQDWTFVDERRARTVLVWIPLVDTDVGAGALRFAAGSQHHGNVRPSPVPNPAYGPPDLGHAAEDMVTVPVPRGHAVVLDHAVVHGSTPNRTDRLRPALGVLWVTEDEPMYHFRLHSDDGTMEAFAVPPDGGWLLDLDPHDGRPPGGRSLGLVAPDRPFDQLEARGAL